MTFSPTLLPLPFCEARLLSQIRNESRTDYFFFPGVLGGCPPTEWAERVGVIAIELLYFVHLLLFILFHDERDYDLR